MTCRYCGTVLPDGALFCGECGQPVTTAHLDAAPTASSVIVPAARSVRGSTSGSGVVIVDSEDSEDSEESEESEDSEDSEDSEPATVGFSIADLAFSSPGETSEPEDEDRELPDGTPLDEVDSAGSGSRCPQCGEAMAEGDVFCGECGFVVRTVVPPAGNLIELGEFPADPDVPEERDADATTEVEPLSVDAIDAGGGTADQPNETDEADGADGDDEADGDDDPAEIDDLVLESGPAFASPEAEADPELELDDPLPFSDPQRPDGEPIRRATPSPRSRPIPDPFPWGTEKPLREDLEATRLVADSAAGTRYVLQFSTGESVTVAGSGLIGRNPSMQPGEYVDQLVPIFDAGKSVSKTHLEFGQEAGRFWVSDRYSTNGSVIRQPDAEPRRCDAGRRYFIARGTRVDVGEQFFVVS